MADPADEQAVFREAMQRAEEAAGITRDDDGNEHVSEEAPVLTPELPEAVPVQASDQPLVPEPAIEADTSVEQPAAVAATVEPQTPEELQAEITRLQARLEDKESMIGRQSGEVGELRGQVDELRARLDAQPAPVAPAAPQVVITQELIDNNPAQATEIAFAQGNEQILAVAFEAWKDIDPSSSTIWLVGKQADRREAALRAELEATRQEVRNLSGPIAANTEQAAWGDAFSLVVKDRPDFLQHAERLLSEVAPQFPNAVAALSGGDARVKAEVLTLLYDSDRGQVTDPAQVREELERQAAEVAAEADAARQGAHVVAQDTSGQPAVEQTEEEREIAAYAGRRDAKPSLSRGWTGRG